MTIRENLRRTAPVGIVLAGLVAAATAAFAGTASAVPTHHRSQCNASDVNVWVSTESVGAGWHDYTLTLAAKRGVTCYVSGSPTNAEFLTASGDVAPVVVSTATPVPAPRVVIDADHSAQINIKTRDEAGIPVRSLRFDIPSGGKNTVTTIAWTPGSIAGQAHFSAAQSVPAHHPSPQAG